MALSTYSRFLYPSCVSSFNIWAVIRSIPGALRELSSLISFIISFIVTARRTSGWLCMLLGPFLSRDPGRRREECCIPKPNRSVSRVCWDEQMVELNTVGFEISLLQASGARMRPDPTAAVTDRLSARTRTIKVTLIPRLTVYIFKLVTCF